MRINQFLIAFGGCHFEARLRPEAPECWPHLNTAVWPEVCTTHLKACKQVLAKNNSGRKNSKLSKVTSWLTFIHISLCQNKYYNMKMIPIVSKKAESSKKGRGELGTLTGVFVNSVYSWFWWHQIIWLFAFESSIQCSCTGGPPVIWIISLYLWNQV